MSSKIKVCVVAHNEQERIIENLVHIANAIRHSEHLFEVHIIANGCSDYTVPLCQSFCKNNHELFTLHDLKVGDKANAWNYFIYEVNDDNNFSIFIDGDCYISVNALDDMWNTFQINPNVNSVSGFPATVGRGSLKWRQNLLEQGETPGNFYSLTPAFIEKIKHLNFKVPFGLIGDDSLLSWVCGNDLSIKNKREKSNFASSINSLFYYERLVPNSFKNIKDYLTRLDRYSLRRLQQKCIREYVDQYDFSTLPHTVTEIYQFKSHITWADIRWDLINTFFDIKNILFIKKT